MISRCPTPLANLVYVRANHPRLPELLRQRRGDALVVECTSSGRGTYALLGAAEAKQRVLFPARWLSARLSSAHEISHESRLLAFARGDASLQRLLDESANEVSTAGMARPDEPLVLLGVPSDVIWGSGSNSLHETRRRAEVWIDRLGRDRVALAVPVGDMDHPLAQLARERDLPLVTLVDADDSMVEELPPGGGDVPLLWTDFHLDREHRLPDDAYVPGLQDLLRRGSLVRERRLYDHLPQEWQELAVHELRALHQWHLGPMLRRLAALVQTMSPLTGADVAPLFPSLEGVCAYLLGLTDRRPTAQLDAAVSARALASSLTAFDRQVVVSVTQAGRRALLQRLSTWAEGGHLAVCGQETEGDGTLRFCFSGQPLWSRARLELGRGGFPRVHLDLDDRRALGWFELRVVPQVALHESASSATSAAEVHELFGVKDAPSPQLSFDLETSSFSADREVRQA